MNVVDAPSWLFPSTLIPLTLYFLTTLPTPESFKNICLGTVGHQVFAPEFLAAAAAQESIQSNYFLEGLAPTQILFIPLMVRRFR